MSKQLSWSARTCANAVTTSSRISVTSCRKLLRSRTASRLDSCATCQNEFASFEATFALLDTWKVADPSPYFDQKLAVRIREEQAMPPAGWFERLQSRLLFNTGRQFRPALVGAMALALLVGGVVLIRR